MSQKSSVKSNGGQNGCLLLHRVTHLIVNNQNKGTGRISWRARSFQLGLMGNFYLFLLPFCRRNAEEWLDSGARSKQSRRHLHMAEVQGWEGRTARMKPRAWPGPLLCLCLWLCRDVFAPTGPCPRASRSQASPSSSRMRETGAILASYGKY